MITKIYLRTLCAITVLLAPTINVADEVRDTVTLNYAAQSDVITNVKFYAEKLKISDGEENVEMTIEGTMKFKSSVHPKGILVSQLDNNISIDADFKEFTQQMEPMLEALSELNINSVISNEGELIELEGMEPVMRSARESIEKLIDASPEEIKPMMNAILESGLTEEAMFRSASENWGLEVAMWIGAEFEKGYVYEGEYSETVPIFGNVLIGFDAVYEYLGKLPCNEYDQAVSCVELSYQSSMKPEYAAHLTNAIADQFKITLPEDFLMSFDMSVVVITEPSTLKIHRFDKIKRVGTPEGNGSSVVEKIDRLSSVYSYE